MFFLNLNFLADKFGSKKGFCRFLLFGGLQFFGAFNKFKPKNIEKTKRLIFVCSGNICRSALGHLIAEKEKFPSDSFGLHCRGNDPAFDKTVAYGLERNLEVTEHRSKNIREYKPMAGDLLIVMEPKHLVELRELFPEVKLLLLGFLTDYNNVYIHDPYNTNNAFFYLCMEQISVATKRLVRLINAQ
ncbi:arsenate-mycothiol transferase ArsC [Alteromonas sp. S167]|uniref:arsenate-mycothiol transferase ArsC n=1 Tax=Alteromonas sp. S167 TaxID=3117402 RepID=UPI002FE12470